MDWENFIKKEILPIIIESPAKSETSRATTFALVGDLGAGKTTFSKKLLKEFGIKKHIQSPTFSIINSYNITEPLVISGMTYAQFKKVFHIDIYRIDNMNELEVLHIHEILSNPEHIVIIEWADKMKNYIPQDAHWLYFEHDTLETRKIILDSHLRRDGVMGSRDNVVGSMDNK